MKSRPFTIHILASGAEVIDSTARKLTDENYLVLTAQDRGRFIENLHSFPADLIFLDASSLGGTHSEFAFLIREKSPQANWVLMVEPSHLSRAAVAVQEGASDYMVKPVVSQEAEILARKFHQLRNLEMENTQLRSRLQHLQRCVKISSSLDTSDILSWGLDTAMDLGFSNSAASCFIRDGNLAFLQAKGSLESKFVRKKVDKLLSTRPAKKSWKIELDGRTFWGQTLFENEKVWAFFLFEADLWKTSEIGPLKELLRYTQTGLKNAVRFEKSQDLVFLDDLTGLYNSRYLGQFLDKELKRADRQGYPVSFLFIDLDRFKPINDRHGHLVGSRLLADVARTFTELVRDVDVLIRYGGDEYVVILINTDTEGAELVAERIRSEIVDTDYLGNMGLENVEGLQLSASIGLATYPRHAKDPRSILKMADEAMYQAKVKSRNAVSVTAKSSEKTL